MICLKCGRTYPLDEKLCSECNFKLQGEEREGKSFGAHFMQFVRSSEEMANQEISPDVYLRVIDNMLSVLGAIEAGIKEDAGSTGLYEVPAEVGRVVEQPVANAEKGVMLYRQVLGKLKKNLENLDAEFIKKSLVQAERAHGYLLLAEQMAEYGAAELEKATHKATGK
ncbi:MAG: hypothetical protein RDV48_10090 [Candidatus Eremiobacteraeota bacterium]|nr:hypothetical protein [Candidatus Eremiobacteraeota bacterium]